MKRSFRSAVSLRAINVINGNKWHEINKAVWVTILIDQEMPRNGEAFRSAPTMFVAKTFRASSLFLPSPAVVGGEEDSTRCSSEVFRWG